MKLVRVEGMVMVAKVTSKVVKQLTAINSRLEFVSVSCLR